MFVPLTRGHMALIDDQDFPMIVDMKWRSCRNYNTFYAQGHVLVDGVWRTVMMHRLILDAPTGVLVDHINGDGLDNRRANLRLVNNSQNQMNRKNVTSSSGYKGVTFLPKSGKWQAQIKKDGKNIYLGVFKTPEQAHAAYTKKARELFGEFRSTAA